MKLTVEQLQHILDTRDNGVLSHGSHKESDGAFCALEAVSLTRGVPFTDDPRTLGMPDIRRLNDAKWTSDKARTKALLPVIAALSDWSAWTPARQQRWASIVALETVRQVIAELPGLSEALRQQCRDASTLSETRAAARAAADAAAYAADAARAAADAADAAYAARAAADAAAYAAAYAADAAAYAAYAARAAADAAAYAADAAYAARAAAYAADAAYAARAAAYAADAAYAARAAASEKVLLRVVNIWLVAVEQSQQQ